MPSSASAGQARSLPIYTTALAWFFVAGCAAMAIYIPLFDRANWELIGSIVLLTAGVLVAAGLFAFKRGSPRLAVALVTVGALAGGLFSIWTLVMPIAALILIGLFAWGGLRGPSIAPRPAS